MADQILRPAHAWEETFGVEILDYDGWRLDDGVDWDTHISVEDFWTRYNLSTVVMSPRDTHPSAGPSGMVAEFHQAFGVPVRTSPTIPPFAEVALRMELLREEFEEYLAAVAANDLVEIADALGDMLYIIHGTAHAYGIPIDAIVREIHRSNMSKLGPDGKPLYREDGKVLKSELFERPQISNILGVTSCSRPNA